VGRPSNRRAPPILECRGTSTPFQSASRPFQHAPRMRFQDTGRAWRVAFVRPPRRYIHRARRAQKIIARLADARNISDRCAPISQVSKAAILAEEDPTSPTSSRILSVAGFSEPKLPPLHHRRDGGGMRSDDLPSKRPPEGSRLAAVSGPPSRFFSVHSVTAMAQEAASTPAFAGRISCPARPEIAFMPLAQRQDRGWGFGADRGPPKDLESRRRDRKPWQLSSTTSIGPD